MPDERTPEPYVHGYSERERERLLDQASTLTELLHADTRYPRGSSVLEAGCGVGAQTVTLARNSPEARASLVSRLRPGGTLTVIEGDHGSTFFNPDDPDARRAIDCLVALQAGGGGDALIGRKLFPLLGAAGLRDVTISPRMVYVDSSRPEWVEGFTRNTFTAMVEGVREQALAAGLVDAEAWARGIAGLRRAAEADGVFCYTFFKGIGVR